LTSLTVSGYGSPAILTEGSTVTVTAYDQNANIDTSFTGTVTLSSSDAKATLPGSYAFQSSDNGAHTFNVTLNTLGSQSITATSGSTTASQTGILVGDAVWVLSHNGFLNKLNSQGGSSVAQIQTYVQSNGTSGGLAMDGSGDIWETNNYVYGIARVNPAGSSSTEFSGGGIISPDAIAIDGAGYVWIANSFGNTVSVFTNSGTAKSSSNGYGSSYISGQALSAASSIAIDRTGGVWVANRTGNTVTHIFGAATPAVTPLSTAVTNGTLGTKP
jgi:streptogramin lyase